MRASRENAPTRSHASSRHPFSRLVSRVSRLASRARAEPSETSNDFRASSPPPRVSPPSSPRVTRPHLRPTQSSRIHPPRPRRPPPPSRRRRRRASRRGVRRLIRHRDRRARATDRPTRDRPTRPTVRSSTTTVSDRRPPSPVSRRATTDRDDRDESHVSVGRGRRGLGRPSVDLPSVHVRMGFHVTPHTREEDGDAHE